MNAARLFIVVLALVIAASAATRGLDRPPSIQTAVASQPADMPVTDPPAVASSAHLATPMLLGVQTHFSQGWSPTLIDRVRSSGAASVRDGVPWARGEPTPGRYALDAAAPPALDAVCRSGASLLLTIAPQHPAYDGGLTAYTNPAIAAFARYAGALADRYRACLAGIEVGNEINDPRNLPYPAGVDGPAHYVALVRAVRTELRRRGSAASVVGGSTNVIGTGFLDRLFAAGLLEAADAIAIHPYRSQAENVDIEIAHLIAVMRRRGRVLPIWATEFSDNYATPEIAAEELVKMAVLLSAAGVERAYWYALIDQRWFRNMGLYAANGDEKPAARAFAQVAALIGSARAMPLDMGDPGIRLFRVGEAYVLWGDGGRVAFSGAPTIRDAYGRTIRTTTVEATPLPVIVSGATTPQLDTPSGIIADTIFDFARPPWSYLAQPRDGPMVSLALSDGQWESSFSSRAYQPLRIGDITAAVAGTATAPVRAVIRYTAPAPQHLSLSACFLKKPSGDGVDITIAAANRTVWRGILTKQVAPNNIDIALARGEALQVIVGPNQSAGGDAFAYRVRLYARGAGRPVACPHRPQPVG